MTKQRNLINSVRSGDYTFISEIFYERTGEKVSASYVRRVILGKVAVNPGTNAEEIIEITDRYLKRKMECKRELIAA